LAFSSHIANFASILKNESSLYKLWIGQLTSQIGTKMFQLSLVWWLASNATNNDAGLQIGLLLICGVLPGILFVKRIGQIVDRQDAKSLILKADLVAGVTCFLVMLLTILYPDQRWPFFVGSFILAFCQAFIDPAMNKWTPKLTSPQHLTFAIGLLSSTLTIAGFFGAFVGTMSITLLGLSGSLMANALSYFASALATARIHKSVETADISVDSNVGLSQSRSFKSMYTQYKWFVLVMLGFALTNLFLTPTLVVMPLMIKKVFLGEALHLAIAEGILWFGMLIGSFAPSSGQDQSSLKGALKVGVICLLSLGVLLAVGGIYPILLLYYLIMMGVGFAVGFLNVRFMSLFHAHVMEADKGAFFALLMAAINVVTPVGLFGFGFLGDHVAANNLTLVQGAGIAAVAGYFFVLSLVSGRKQMT
jgi:MFS family permease